MSSLSVAVPLPAVARQAPLQWGRLTLIGAAWSVFAFFLLLPLVIWMSAKVTAEAATILARLSRSYRLLSAVDAVPEPAA